MILRYYSTDQIQSFILVFIHMSLMTYQSNINAKYSRLYW
jgi:hypothetical protein